MTRLLVASIATTVLAFGCGTTHLDAGSNSDPGEDVEGHVWGGTPSNSYDIPCEAPAPDWLAGTWQGQFDAYTLLSGSSAVRIDVQGLQAGGWVCGTVVFGMGDPLPLPTDPKAPPPGVSKASDYGKLITAPLREGFPYEALSADAAHDWPPLVDQRIRFMINLAEAYKAWCNMQPSYPWTQADIDRLGPGGQGPVYTCQSPGQRVWVDESPYCGGSLAIGRSSCAQVAFCFLGNLCACYGPGASVGSPGGMWDGITDGCTAATYDTPPLDLTVTDGTMAGNVVFRDSIEGMRLTRAP